MPCAGVEQQVEITSCRQARFLCSFCPRHGAQARRLLPDARAKAARDKVPEFIPLFHKYNLETEDINTIKTAVSNHSQYVELRKNHPHYLVTSLLKDADALDRIRLGDGNLNPKYLRHKASLELKDFSRNLYLKSERIPVSNFETMLDMAQELYGSELMGL